MRNAGAMKGILDSKKDGGGKAPQAQAFKNRKSSEREEAIRRDEERSTLENKKGDRA